MSNIYGWWKTNGAPIELDKWEQIKLVSSWWKPDKTSTFLNKNIGLAHLRLDINSKDNQGIDDNTIHTSGHYTITADVRLDNRKELLEKLHIQNATIPDSLLILKTYIKYGERCVNHLLGAFAFIIWDQQKQEFFAARDHIGIKPFNYYFKDGIFLFGSQKKSILAIEQVNRHVDWQFVVLRFSIRISLKDKTENLHIKKLLPAHVLKVNKSKVHTYRYWDLDVSSEIRYKNEQDYIDHFVEIFKNSIKARMRGSSQVSSHLSGGLDSGGVTGVSAEVAKKMNKTFHSFSYVFPEDKKIILPKGIYNFNHLVKEQIAYSGIENGHLVTQAANTKFKDRISNEVLVADGLSWSNNINTEFEIQSLAQQKGVGLNLSGFLGDEIITSFVRPYYLEYLERSQYFKFFKSKHRGVYQPKQLTVLFVLNLMSKLGIPYNQSFFAKKYMEYRMKKFTYDHISNTHLFSKDYISANTDLAEALIDNFSPHIHEEIPLTLKEYQRNHINRVWTSRRIEGENLAALKFRMEYRYPMSDIRLLQYVLSLPVEQKRNHEFSRLIFRRAMKGYVHDNTRWGIKYNSFLKPPTNFRDRIKDTTLSEFWKDAKENQIVKFLDKAHIDEMIKYKRELIKFYNYAILIEMVKQNKLSY